MQRIVKPIPSLRLSLPFYLFRRWVRFGDPIRLFAHLHKTYGNIASYNFMGRPIIFINDPRYIEAVLVYDAHRYVKERTVRRMKILLGEGLITSEDPLHIRQRRIVAPAFHRQRIAAYAGQIVSIASHHCDQWQAGQTANPVVDIAAASMALSLEIVARTLFNTEVTPDIRAINDEVNAIMGLYNFIVALPRLEHFLHLPIPGLIKFRRSKAHLDSVVSRLIRERRAEVASNPESADKGDLLSMLLASTYEPVETSTGSTGNDGSTGTNGGSTGNDGSAGIKGGSTGLQPGERASQRKGASAPGLPPTHPEHMSDAQIRDEILTIFLAGYETVANALTWTWYLISQHPEVEAKLHAELDAVLSRRRPTLADYPNLKYTEQVFAESMRLYPPAWAMGRMCTTGAHLGEFNIPPGAYVFFSQYIMSRTEEFFPDPLRFDPDRFTPEAKAARPRFTYFPFGGGSRQCIGESFAWMEGVLSIATIAQRWRMTYLGSKPPTPQPKITLRPRDPVMMRLTPR